MKNIFYSIMIGSILAFGFLFVFFNVLDILFYGYPSTLFESTNGVIIKKYEVTRVEEEENRLVINKLNWALMQPRKNVRYGKFFEIKTSFGFIRKVYILEDKIYNKYDVGDTIEWETE